MSEVSELDKRRKLQLGRSPSGKRKQEQETTPVNLSFPVSQRTLLQDKEKAIVSQIIVGIAVSEAAPGKLVRDGVKRIWASPNACKARTLNS